MEESDILNMVINLEPPLINETITSNQTNPKVFFLGFPKTGSFSFSYYFDSITKKKVDDSMALLNDIKYQHQWGQEMGNKLDIQPLEFSKAFVSSIDLEALDKILEENDIFATFPFMLLYDYLAKKYPDAYFVNFVRNPMEWYQSMTIYFGSDLKKEKNNIFEALFGSQVPGRSRKDYLEKYLQWNQAIKNYFTKEHPELNFLSLDLSISNQEKTNCLKKKLPKEMIPETTFPTKHFTRLKKHSYRNLSFQKFNFKDRIMDRMEFIDIDFRKANLTNTFFKGCQIVRCDFRHVDLATAQFENCEIKECLFDDLMPPLNIFIRVTYHKLEELIQEGVEKALENNKKKETDKKRKKEIRKEEKKSEEKK